MSKIPIDVPTNLENIKPKARSPRRYSTGNSTIIPSEPNPLPNYLRASIGSCHDFCKYGIKRDFQTSKILPPSPKDDKNANMPQKERSEKYYIRGKMAAESPKLVAASPKQRPKLKTFGTNTFSHRPTVKQGNKTLLKSSSNVRISRNDANKDTRISKISKKSDFLPLSGKGSTPTNKTRKKVSQLEIKKSVEKSVISELEIKKSVEKPTISQLEIFEIKKSVEKPVVSQLEIKKSVEKPAISQLEIKKSLEKSAISQLDIKKSVAKPAISQLEIKKSVEKFSISELEIKKSVEKPAISQLETKKSVEESAIDQEKCYENIVPEKIIHVIDLKEENRNEDPASNPTPKQSQKMHSLAENRTSLRRVVSEGDLIDQKNRNEYTKEVLRRRVMEETKSNPNLMNNMIEEAASKLAKMRKSKVKALVGAFESVIKIQDCGSPKTS